MAVVDSRGILYQSREISQTSTTVTTVSEALFIMELSPTDAWASLPYQTYKNGQIKHLHRH